MTVRMLHASDVHVDNRPEGAKGVVQLIDAALALDVDLVLMVGDTFDDARVRQHRLELFVEQVDRFRKPIVILPGNHDPYMAGCVYERMTLPDHVVVFTEADGHHHELPELGIDLWGRPHRSFNDCRPLQGLPPRGRQRWQVALAHGHLVRYPEDRMRSYLITAEEIAATGRDYVALGHWDVQHDVSAGDVTAWYSGSPHRFDTCALVTFPPADVPVQRPVVTSVRLGAARS